MNMQLVYTLNLVFLVNCVIIVAKNETESEKKLDTKLNQSIFAEGLSQSPDDEPKRRIFGRKGVIMSSNDTNDEILKSQNDSSSVQDNSLTHNSVVAVSTTTSAVITVHKNSVNNTQNVSLVTKKINQTEQKTSSIIQRVSTNLSSTTISNNSKSLNTSTMSASTKSLVQTTTTKTTTTSTTHKPKKPDITYSAYDDPTIRESEKNINYNVANEKSEELPKLEQDIDRTMLDEKRAQNSYMLYLGLVFALPTTFVLINIAYRRIKTYLELRHYTRVDFLVDGMYVS